MATEKKLLEGKELLAAMQGAAVELLHLLSLRPGDPQFMVSLALGTAYLDGANAALTDEIVRLTKAQLNPLDANWIKAERGTVA